MTTPKNTHGGARQNAGRKPKPAAVGKAPMTPLEFLLAVMLGELDANPAQIKAAIAAAPFVHERTAGSAGKGKKAAAQEAANRVAGGKFKPAPLPGTVTPIRPATDWGDDLMTPDSALN